MKVHILFRDVDYETSDILAVYKNLRTANSRYKWCADNRLALRTQAYGVGTSGLLGKFHKYFGNHACPGDSYHLETWEVK